ncbi:MAG: hypothetical protein JRI68_25505 [Deltaproteobacteria bacterium]|nr:hypothetical protein [Deltaproteobacteria bacterium]
MRFSPLVLLLLPALMACDSSNKDGDPSSPTAAAKPAVVIVARDVTVEKTIQGHAPGGGVEEESWSAVDGEVYVVVTADLVHNQCAEGDKIEAKNATLLVPDKGEIKISGGGATLRDLCVMCQPSDALDCSGGSAEMRPYTFVFSVPEKTDVAKAKVRYGGGESPLSDAKIADRRGNDKINKQIRHKEIQIAGMQKKLENTGSVAGGKLILQEMDEIRREIEVLKNKRK